jgi:hypothetical protein
MPDDLYLYHAAPLHYLAHIIRDGALYAQSVLASRGIAPRVTAKRRDRMLGLADYVHLSLEAQTPLLADKIGKGYPHALMEFERTAVLALPQVALLPYNTKAWYTRAAYAPVMEPEDREWLLQRHREGRYPSLEVLVKYGLELAALNRIVFLADNECQMIAALLGRLAIPWPAPLVTDISHFPRSDAYRPVSWEAMAAYFDDCTRAGELLPPPELPFD